MPRFFRKNNQRRTILSCAAHSPSEGHLSRVAHLSCLLVLLTATFCAVAQNGNGVTVSNLVLDAGTVTFDVSWGDKPLLAVWSDSVWVFVDYNDAGTMRRLPLSPGATLTAHTAPPEVGKVMEKTGNNKGVWVVGNARSAGSFSATVQLLIDTDAMQCADAMHCLSAGACVYASNYPPVGDYTSATNISFKGTPSYELTFEYAGNTFTLPSGSTYLLPAGYTLLSFTDATGAPGIIHCLKPAPPTIVDATFCFGLPGQLQASASGNATVVWYDAAGNLLYTGNVLPLTPLYNNTTQYYAQAVSEDNCPSVRTVANYTVNNCVINGYCPGFVAGNVGVTPTPVACSAFDSGLIGIVNDQKACEVFYPGQIGTKSYPAACMSYDAGWIGN